MPIDAVWSISTEEMFILFDKDVTPVGLFPDQWLIKMIGLQRIVTSISVIAFGIISLTTVPGPGIPGMNRIEYTSPPIGLVSELGNPVDSFVFTDIQTAP